MIEPNAYRDAAILRQSAQSHAVWTLHSLCISSSQEHQCHCYQISVHNVQQLSLPPPPEIRHLDPNQLFWAKDSVICWKSIDMKTQLSHLGRKPGSDRSLGIRWNIIGCMAETPLRQTTWWNLQRNCKCNQYTSFFNSDLNNYAKS